MPLLSFHMQAWGHEGPIPPAGHQGQVMKVGRSLRPGPQKATGASLSLVCDIDLRIQQDAASLLGSAPLVL